jgi:hypothetical protein
MRGLIFDSLEERQVYLKKCKQKKKETASLWNKNNVQKTRLIQKKYCDKNREVLNKKAVTYRKENREIYLIKRRTNAINKKLNDPIYKFSENLRSLINMSFKRTSIKYKKSSRTEEILGCSIEFFINYMLSKGPSDISVEDFHQHGYHIDHIIPISAAKTKEDIVKLSHYTNFQPLWYTENIKKSNKI